MRPLGIGQREPVAVRGDRTRPTTIEPLDEDPVECRTLKAESVKIVSSVIIGSTNNCTVHEACQRKYKNNLDTSSNLT